MREPERILESAVRTSDLDRPIALMFMRTLGHLTDHGQARDLVLRLLDSLPSGSFSTINDGTNVLGTANSEAHEQYDQSGGAPYLQCSSEESAAFFEGLELVEAGPGEPVARRRDGVRAPTRGRQVRGVAHTP
ncbi:SAM-dependent methyltransferase [Nocardiopsis listeri]|uniref:SAM-dependent methyltransferase n=1 Tax=Nocardiopsis listeri TaxID=53440 RepID=UPI000831EE97|nr:SAM-dependent methyltransferase [Nocardiopsis listeri]